jgi:hypothetical protein
VKDSQIAPPEVHAPAKEPCCSKGARRRTHNRHRLVATTLHLNLLKMAQIRRSSRRLRRACVRGYLPPRRFSRAGARSHHELTQCARCPLALAARRPIVRAFADIRIAGRLGGPAGRVNADCGGVAEWLKAHAWKVCMRETVSRVRIPLPPPTRPRPKFSVALQARKNPQ